MTSTEYLETLRQELSHPATSGCRRKTTAAISISWRGGRYSEVGVERFVNGPLEGAWCDDAVGACGCAHAEQRLIAAHLANVVAGHARPEALDIACTLAPCVSCANLILLMREPLIITRVFYLRSYHDNRGIALLRRGGMHVEAI